MVKHVPSALIGPHQSYHIALHHDLDIALPYITLNYTTLHYITPHIFDCIASYMQYSTDKREHINI